MSSNEKSFDFFQHYYLPAFSQNKNNYFSNNIDGILRYI